MKKIFYTIVLALALSSCYDDYVKDFDNDAVYFSYQYDVRTFVVGEGMKFKFGVGLGGVIVNDRDRIVDYSIDPTLISPDSVGQLALSEMQGSSLEYIKSATANVNKFHLLPASYYNLTDGSKFVIQKGQHAGVITIRPDSATFLSDSLALEPNYVLPLRIVAADADSVVTSKRTTLIAVKYENMLFGNYWHGGVTVVKNPQGTPIDTIYYYTSIPSSESKVWSLKTTAPFELTTNAYGDVSKSSRQELKLTLDGTGIQIGSAKGSSYNFESDGASSFNKSRLLQDRKLFLNYKYEVNGNTYHATDTLTFRNRVRDGINEWMDENPAHYN